MYSVIIAAKNELPHLWYTVHAIRQMWAHYPDEGGELIVVDDSNDGTDQFLNTWSVKEFVKMIRADGASAAYARHIGAEAAKGDVLFFFDAHGLLGHDFFNRALHTIRSRVWDDLGTIHYPGNWNGMHHHMASTHYTLTLERNFWGNNTAGNFRDLTETAGGAHFAMAVRKDRFFEVGGYQAPFVEYAGEECYLNLKMRMFGYKNYSDPSTYYLHCSTRKYGYHWSHDTVFRNEALAAYVLGDRAWSDQICAAYKEDRDHDTVDRLYAEALEAGVAEREFIRQNARFTLDEVLADLKARGVPH